MSVTTPQLGMISWCPTMPNLTLILDGDNCWPDLQEKAYQESRAPIQVAVLPQGMASGKPSITFRLDLPDGSIAIAQTSVALLIAAVRMITVKHHKTLADPLIGALRNFWVEWPDPRLKKHGKWESEVLWLELDRIFNDGN